MAYGDRSLDDFRPFTGPYQRAMELRDFVENIKFKREQRQAQREQWRMEMESHKRQSAFQDYIASMNLAEHGGIQAGPNDQLVEGALDETLGPMKPEDRRPIVSAPNGSKHYLPSQSDKRARAITDAEAAGRAEGYKKKAENEIFDPDEELDLGPRYGNRKIKVPRSKAADLLIKLNPHLQRETLGPNDAGDYTIIFRDPQTGEERYRTTEKGAGKTKTEPQEIERSIPSSTMKRFENKASIMADAYMRQKYPNGVENPNWVEARRKATEAGLNPDELGSMAVFGNPPRYVKDYRATDEWKQKQGEMLDQYLNEEESKRSQTRLGGGNGARPKTTPTGKATAPRKVDDLVMHGGKKYKVVGVQPNGELDLEPVP